MSGFDPDRQERLRAATQAWVERDKTQAIAYVIMQGGDVIMREAFGHITPWDGAETVSCASVFRISSVSKVITAAVAMSLVDDGLISLSRKVSHYLPEFSGADRDAVLVKDLFTHTSGLASPNYNAILNARLLLPGGSHRPVSAEDFLAAALETSPTTPPGSMCQYAGVNYLLLGEIVARRTGKTFEDAAKERILAPLGMEDSGFGLTLDMIPKWVQVDPDIFKDVDPPYDPNDIAELRIPHPSGHLFSTADDMAAFCQMFLDQGQHKGKRVLSSAAVAAMTRNQIHAASAMAPGGQLIPKSSWGLGWMLQDTYPWKEARRGILPSPSAFHHQGAAGIGIWVDPEHQIVGVYLSTIRTYDADTDEYDWDFDLFQNMVSAAFIP